ncbi:AtpZ/AtpI family protein [uncultured Roseibium sp.]|uniref:AtpZ/AtpI family protein n=1 Tax=uncultured Roseibium sp. TaxID=1936171 RepID=UPI0032163FC6
MTRKDRHSYDESAGRQADEIARKAKRKREAHLREGKSELYGLGMFGLVGWAVAIPTVLGTALGVWMDDRMISNPKFSWTLAMLLAGVALGCMNAWYWVQRESQDDDDDED